MTEFFDNIFNVLSGVTKADDRDLIFDCGSFNMMITDIPRNALFKNVIITHIVAKEDNMIAVITPDASINKMLEYCIFDLSLQNGCNFSMVGKYYYDIKNFLWYPFTITAKLSEPCQCYSRYTHYY